MDRHVVRERRDVVGRALLVHALKVAHGEPGGLVHLPEVAICAGCGGPRSGPEAYRHAAVRLVVRDRPRDDPDLEITGTLRDPVHRLQHHIGLRHIVVGNRHARGTRSRGDRVVGDLEERPGDRGMRLVCVIVQGCDREHRGGVAHPEGDVSVARRAIEHVAPVLDAHAHPQRLRETTGSGEPEVDVLTFVDRRVDRRDRHRGQRMVGHGLVRERRGLETRPVADRVGGGRVVANLHRVGGNHRRSERQGDELFVDPDGVHRAGRAPDRDHEDATGRRRVLVQGLAEAEGEGGAVHERFHERRRDGVHLVPRLHLQSAVLQPRTRAAAVFESSAVQRQTSAGDAHAVRVGVSGRDHVGEHQFVGG